MIRKRVCTQHLGGIVATTISQGLGAGEGRETISDKRKKKLQRRGNQTFLAKKWRKEAS